MDSRVAVTLFRWVHILSSVLVHEWQHHSKTKPAELKKMLLLFTHVYSELALDLCFECIHEEYVPHMCYLCVCVLVCVFMLCFTWSLLGIRCESSHLEHECEPPPRCERLSRLSDETDGLQGRCKRVCVCVCVCVCVFHNSPEVTQNHNAIMNP